MLGLLCQGDSRRVCAIIPQNSHYDDVLYLMNRIEIFKSTPAHFHVFRPRYLLNFLRRRIEFTPTLDFGSNDQSLGPVPKGNCLLTL
jgi:hypothetical protein